jgi:hypothetical protein
MAFSDRALHDKNMVPSATFEVDQVPGTVMAGQIDQSTGRILVDLAGGGIPVISSAMQKDIFSSTNAQTTFIPSKTVVYDFYMSVNGSIQTPSTDYSIIGGNYVLNSGIPSGNAVILLYSIA